MDDRDWKAVTVYHPTLTVSAEILEPNRRTEKITPIKIEETQEGAYRVDMGVNFAGMIEIDLKGEPGEVVEMQFSEDPEKMITHRLHSAYRIGPNGKGTFRNRFNYGSGRWILIKNLNYKPSLDEIRGYQVRTDFGRAR